MDLRTNIDYRSIVDHMTTAVLLLNADLTVHYMNSACESLFEMSFLRAYGMRAKHLVELSEDSQFSLEEVLQKTLDTAQPYTHREALLNISLKDRFVDYTVSLLPNNKTGTLLIEFQQIDRLLRISKEELHIQQHQIARQLIRGLAHEIKNPLGGIRGATQLLARNVKDAQIKEYTDIIIDEVDRLRNLADTMLGSRQMPSYEPVNIHEPLERVRSLVLSQTKNKIKVQRDYDLSLPDVIADRDQLIQVILNICVNAVQAMTENAEFFHQNDTPRLTFRTRIQRLVTIQGVHHRSAVRVDIEDNGPGIPADILESVFYPMVSGRANGTGLGLSIAQNIMRQHQGMIECHSEAGQTIFSLYLPWENRT